MGSEVRGMRKGTKISANIVMTIVIIWLLIPLAATIIYSLFEDWTGIIPRGFTLANYQKIFSDTASPLPITRIRRDPSPVHPDPS